MSEAYNMDLLSYLFFVFGGYWPVEADPSSSYSSPFTFTWSSPQLGEDDYGFSSFPR
jgi:hypothetical protein